jgi:hypothetical protein
LDRLGWAAGFAFRSYGLRIGIRVSQPGFLETLSDTLPPVWDPAASPVVDSLYSLRLADSGARPGTRQYHLLYAGAGLLARTTDLREVLRVLNAHLYDSIAALAPRHVFVRAGAVGWRGEAILLPGRGASGKTRLVAALVRAGATYYSDEYAVLDARGRVHPYPRPLPLDEEPGGRPEKGGVTSSGSGIGRRSLPVGLIVLTRYQCGTQWRPRLLSPGQALLALLENAVSVRLRPDLALSALRHVASQAPALRGRRGEAEEIVAFLRSRIGCRGKDSEEK